MTERFTLLSELGRGGMGVVWKARDEQTGQFVALKLLRETYADDPDYVKRFERELELARRIHSRNVVFVLGYGVRDKTPYLALEYVDGSSLRDLLATHGAYSWPETRAMLAQIAQGLADAHTADVIHRDLKPSNVLIGSDGVAKIADFGIAKGLDLTRVTGTSTLLGTPAYLPPEGPNDARSDLYSLGVIGYEMLTGVVPFEGRTYQEVILRHVREIPNLERLPAEARPLIGWLLAKDAAQRPRTAAQFIAALSGTARPPQRPPVPMAPPQTLEYGNLGLQRSPSSGGHAGRQWQILFVIGALSVCVIIGAGLALASAGAGQASPSTRTATVPGSDTGSLPPLAAGNTSLPTSSAVALPTTSAGPVQKWLGYQSLSLPLWGSGAARLSDGRIAVFSACADSSCNTATASTWVFDPSTNSLSSGGPMANTLFNPAVASFDDGGYVMIAGGRAGSGGGAPVRDAELLNTRTGLFEAIDPMSFPRDQATATDLGNGRVIVAGGWIAKANGVNTPTDSAEIFDIKTRAWSPAHPMNAARAVATATRLQDGRVLVVGGDDLWQGAYAPNTQHTLSAAEIYDPSTDTWKTAGNMTTARAAACALLLADGHVLVMGGWIDGNERGLATTDEYTPGGGWQGGPMPGGHALGRAVVLPDGRVVVMGGLGADSNATAEADVYASGAWQRTGDMQQAVYRPAAIALDDGRVLVVGGETSTDVDNPPAPIQVYWP